MAWSHHFAGTQLSAEIQVPEVQEQEVPAEELSGEDNEGDN